MGEFPNCGFVFVSNPYCFTGYLSLDAWDNMFSVKATDNLALYNAIMQHVDFS